MKNLDDKYQGKYEVSVFGKNNILGYYSSELSFISGLRLEDIPEEGIFIRYIPLPGEKLRQPFIVKKPENNEKIY